MTEKQLNHQNEHKRVAVIGSGISGLGAAHYLQHGYDVTVFEAGDYAGGHTATKTIAVPEGQFDIDTGFIVFNEWTYPNFLRLLDELGVKAKPTDMGFSVSCEQSGLEYSGNSLSTMFAQRKRLLSLKHWRFIRDIVKFNNTSKKLLAEDKIDEDLTLGKYLKSLNLSTYFAEKYLIPMGAAIWSAGLQDMYSFPALYFIRFFKNHGLLNINDRPQWFVVDGGSKQYVERILADKNFHLRLNCPVSRVMPDKDGVRVMVNGFYEVFDHVIMACHSDQATQLLDPSCEAQHAVLSKLAYKQNEVVLHTDTRLLPTLTQTWSSWNYRLKEDDEALPTLTYSMNILQGFECETQFCVTLNDTSSIDPSKVLGTYQYSHPVYTRGSIAAQNQRHDINGQDNIWFCGAYWYAGFHEDGLRSALDVVKALGVDIDVL